MAFEIRSHEFSKRLTPTPPNPYGKQSGVRGTLSNSKLTIRSLHVPWAANGISNGGLAPKPPGKKLLTKGLGGDAPIGNHSKPYAPRRAPHAFGRGDGNAPPRQGRGSPKETPLRFHRRSTLFPPTGFGGLGAPALKKSWPSYFEWP